MSDVSSCRSDGKEQKMRGSIKEPNIYVPPPARRSDYLKTSGRGLQKLNYSTKNTRLCDDSNLLFVASKEVKSKGQPHKSSLKVLKKNAKKEDKKSDQKYTVEVGTSLKISHLQNSLESLDIKNSLKEKECNLCSTNSSIPKFVSSEMTKSTPSASKKKVSVSGKKKSKILSPDLNVATTILNQRCSAPDQLLMGSSSVKSSSSNKQGSRNLSDVEREDVDTNFGVDEALGENVDKNLGVNEKILASVETMKSELDSIVNENISVLINPIVDKDEFEWEALYDESGDCWGSLFHEESYQETKTSDANSKCDNSHIVSDGESILEIYDFPSSIKTQDLMSIFGNYAGRGFYIKWVDDTHALGVFSSVFVADEVLATNLPMVKTRPLRLGIPASKEKAKRITIPAALRPKTCAAMAKRLVSGALGLKLQVSMADKEAERKLLREAREQRRLAAQQRDAAWEGTLRTN